MRRDPIAFWKGYLKTDAKVLAELAGTIFSIVVNQAGVERVFSFVKEHTKDRRNRLGLIDAQAVGTLLDVPRYANLLQDQADEDSSECGRALVQSAAGWRTEMARWVSDAKEAEAEEIDGDIEENNFPVIPIPPRLSQLRAPRKWQPITLERLFAKTVKESLRARRGERMARRAQEEEEMYMQVMAALDA
ncbi:hypothetical protein B0H10DRAFT_2211301 [Mycena sp. CBHHK59/15]|nr:hypothetical protein B0H10DRAFT_2211301 [Mycena sp. CBHHK59/15]